MVIGGNTLQLVQIPDGSRPFPARRSRQQLPNVPPVDETKSSAAKL
jgi:hypothetical protein